ncbi:hypothetical protein [Natronococcus occultus]|uniref:hypothetical protein n=1 Tax=Natronococcus occultus TaxID=29288 RepID=UPI000677E74F|nr:hypothetical protein [Natronococcus occultus]
MSKAADSDADDPYLYYRTALREEDGAVVVTTEPHQLDNPREYRFRRLPSGRLLAPKSATWHTIAYLRDELEYDVLTPGVFDDQVLLIDYED